MIFLREVKKFFLAVIPSYLEDSALIDYWKLLSRAASIVYRSPFIVEIKVVQVEREQSEKIYEVTFPEEKVYVQSASRISRFLRGIDHAGLRMYEIYFGNFGESLHATEEVSNVIFDVGANIGEFTMFCARNYKDIVIVAIEPDPIAFLCLRQNLESNGLLSKVKLLNIALGEKEGRADFYISTKSADSSLFKPRSFSKILQVEVKRLDNLMRQLGIENVAVLKMDAEGFEPEVLMGAGVDLRKISLASIDVGPERGGKTTSNECDDLFKSVGFSTQIKQNINGRQVLLARRTADSLM